MAEEIIPLKTADRVSGGLSKVVLLERDAADFYFFFKSHLSIRVPQIAGRNLRG